MSKDELTKQRNELLIEMKRAHNQLDNLDIKGAKATLQRSIFKNTKLTWK